MDGLDLIDSIKDEKIKICFFDPQYRGIMDKIKYGNKGARQKKRVSLKQMDEKLIFEFIKEISRVLVKSGPLFLWIDKFHLCEGIGSWFIDTDLNIVDLVTWDKVRMGMGYRTRNIY